MNLLKNALLLPALCVLIGLSSCKDDGCTAPEISENIIGTWDTALSSGEVTFNADGTYVDNGEVLFGFESNGVVYDQRTYTINSDTLKLTLAPPNSFNMVSTSFEVAQNECDEIKITLLGFGVTETLTRK